jgi:RimJ/RimL family protein N-acetyltransferase
MNQNMVSGQILFRPTKNADLNLVLSMEQDPENKLFVRQWTREQHLAAIADKNTAHLVIIAPSDDIVGYLILIGVKNIDKSIECKRIVIGKQGKGFGKAAVRFIKKMVFEEYNAHRLWLEVMVHNDRAHSLYLSEGFTEEGLHRESLKQGENFISLRVMSILKHEYNGNT